MFPAFLRRLFGARPLPAEDAAELRRLVENSRDVLCRVGPDMRIRYCSPAAPAVLGLPCEALLGRMPSDFVLEEDRPLIAAEAERVAAGEEARPTIVRVPRPDGALVWIETTTRTIRDPDSGRPDEFVLVMRDVSERHLAHQRLEQDAVTDALTGLANRRAFDDTLAREWARAVRADTELSLILIDVDHFKTFNDHYGHPAGDACLRRVSGAIQDVIRRPGDLAARYGGEEMAVILPRTPSSGAALVAESLRIAVEGLGVAHQAGSGGRLTVSLGAATAVAAVGPLIPMPEGLVIAADGALYRAKSRGRNRVETTTLLPPRSSIRVA
jgi:diguanylate cyclase (GGDEF)-like protein/PAS domain S-box-containing protein